MTIEACLSQVIPVAHQMMMMMMMMITVIMIVKKVRQSWIANSNYYYYYYYYYCGCVDLTLIFNNYDTPLTMCEDEVIISFKISLYCS